MSKTINDLRDHLFNALDGLSNGSMDIDRAKAISEVAQTIINSAKVEVDHLKVAGGKSSGFITETPQPGNGDNPQLRRTVHRIGG